MIKKYTIIILLIIIAVSSCSKNNQEESVEYKTVEIETVYEIEINDSHVTGSISEFQKGRVRKGALIYQNDVPSISDIKEYLIIYSDEELEQVTELHIGQNKIEKITGLERFKNLHSIILNQNILTDISGLKSCPGLTGISLGRNPIEDITPVYSFENLVGLDIEFTNVSSLKGIENLQKLEYLGLAGSKVNDLTPLLQLSNIKELTIRETPASERMNYTLWVDKMKKISPDITIYY